MNTPGLQILREFGKEICGDALDKDIDFPGATETASRVKRDNSRLTGPQNFARALSDFVFQATSAQ